MFQRRLFKCLNVINKNSIIYQKLEQLYTEILNELLWNACFLYWRVTRVTCLLQIKHL